MDTTAGYKLSKLIKVFFSKYFSQNASATHYFKGQHQQQVIKRITRNNDTCMNINVFMMIT